MILLQHYNILHWGLYFHTTVHQHMQGHIDRVISNRGELEVGIYQAFGAREIWDWTPGIATPK